MSKRINELFLFDIYISIEKILYHSSKFNNGEELQYSYVDWDVIIREFEIIGEATNNLIKSGYFTNDKRAIVDFRNLLTHEYFGISNEEVWSIIVSYLPKFELEVKSILLKIDNNIFDNLLSQMKNENHHIDFIIQSLKKLENAKK